MFLFCSSIYFYLSIYYEIDKIHKKAHSGSDLFMSLMK